MLCSTKTEGRKRDLQTNRETDRKSTKTEGRNRKNRQREIQIEREARIQNGVMRMTHSTIGGFV